jgi:hypothetical protein
MTEKHNARDGSADGIDPQVEADAEREQDEAVTPAEEIFEAPLGDHRSFFDNEIPIGDEPLR